MVGNPIHTVYLHGKLKEKFGEKFELMIQTPVEAVRALGFLLDGFLGDMNEGYYRLVKGDQDHGKHYDETTMHFSLGKDVCDFHIIPAIEGAKGGGLGKVILGAVITIAAVVASPFTAGASLGVAMGTSALGFVTYGGIAAFGALIALSGISQMLQPSMKTDYDAQEAPDQRSSYQLGGQVNQTAQGGAIPLAYGRIRVGSVVISAGLSTSNLI